MSLTIVNTFIDKLIGKEESLITPIIFTLVFSIAFKNYYMQRYDVVEIKSFFNILEFIVNGFSIYLMISLAITLAWLNCHWLDPEYIKLISSGVLIILLSTFIYSGFISFQNIKINTINIFSYMQNNRWYITIFYIFFCFFKHSSLYDEKSVQ